MTDQYYIASFRRVDSTPDGTSVATTVCRSFSEAATLMEIWDWYLQPNGGYANKGALEIIRDEAP